MKRTKEIGYELLRVVDMDGFMELWNRTDTETKDKIVNGIGELAVKLVSGVDTSEGQLTIPDVSKFVTCYTCNVTKGKLPKGDNYCNMCDHYF